PACGVGLTCWPGAPGTQVTQAGVTCPLLEYCRNRRGDSLHFDIVTAQAPWSSRWAPNVELYPHPLSYTSVTGVPTIAPPNSLVLFGGRDQNNDVWVSTTVGR